MKCTLNLVSAIEHQLILVCAADLLQTIVMNLYFWCGCISRKMVNLLLYIPSSTHLSTLPANHILVSNLPTTHSQLVRDLHARSKYNFFNVVIVALYLHALLQVLQAARQPHILVSKLHARQYHSLFAMSQSNTWQHFFLHDTIDLSVHHR